FIFGLNDKLTRLDSHQLEYIKGTLRGAPKDAKTASPPHSLDYQLLCGYPITSNSITLFISFNVFYIRRNISILNDLLIPLRALRALREIFTGKGTPEPNPIIFEICSSILSAKVQKGPHRY
ncbi:MAG: hypothetical protein JW969_21310, partial [Spirochaetales bacterium]|nr:hypothetical protein [Spirochaetales bacterium]